MHGLDAKRFRKEIALFKKTIAPTDGQWNYLNGVKNEVETKILKDSEKHGCSVERALLVAICGMPLGNKQLQAEFTSRLILLDLLTE